MRKTQLHLFYEAHEKLAARNRAFMDLVRDGLTREELQKLLDKRPEFYGPYRHYLNTLPSKAEVSNNEI